MCGRVLQIVKTTQTFRHSQVFRPPKFHKIWNWLVLGRLWNPVPKYETRFRKFLDLHKYFASFWTLKLCFDFGNWVSEPSLNWPVSYCSDNSKKSVLQGLNVQFKHHFVKSWWGNSLFGFLATYSTYLGPLHTRHFHTQYCDKKTLRYKDVAIKIYFFIQYIFPVCTCIENIYFYTNLNIFNCHDNILKKKIYFYQNVFLSFNRNIVFEKV